MEGRARGESRGSGRVCSRIKPVWLDSSRRAE